MEKLLIKLNRFPYKEHLILKGGYVLSTTLGLDKRSTRDLDTTVRNLSLDRKKIEEIADFITQTDQETSHFELIGIKETREAFEYKGYELKLHYVNGKEGDTNSRMKDLYDLHILSKSYDMINYAKVAEAVNKTMVQKNNVISVEEYEQIICFLHSSDQQQVTWNNYQRLYPFAHNLPFDDVMESVTFISSQVKAC